MPRRQASRVVSVPAPLGGLNARDPLANMAKTDAVIMDNWFPDVAQVTLRRGYASYTTGFASPVQSLMPYKKGNTAKLFAAAGTAFYDATAGGSVGAAVVTGLSNAKWQHVQFGTAGGQFLICVNGADSMRQYDGATWTAITGVSTPAITGVATSALTQVNIFKQRVWAVEGGTMRAWYLPLDSIAGTANSIDFGSRFKLGGSLLFMTTWTLDNSAGIDDYAVFVTTEGEIAVYKGTDPSNATTWALVGIFRVGRPVGVRSYFKVSGDVILITADGFVSLEKSAIIDRNEQQVAISQKIVNLATSDVEQYSTNFGWEGILHPIGNKMLFNVPYGTAMSYQYVMNTITGAWCRFTGWNANCFALQNDVLYFGGATSVAKCDFGTDDDGMAITTDCLPAFNYFGQPGQKRFTGCRPILSCTVQPTAALELYTDFNTVLTTTSPTLFQDNSAAAWDVSLWNVSLWSGSAAQTYRDWYSLAGIGFAGSTRFRVQAKNVSLGWASTDIILEDGGTL